MVNLSLGKFVVKHDIFHYFGKSSNSLVRLVYVRFRFGLVRLCLVRFVYVKLVKAGLV